MGAWHLTDSTAFFWFYQEKEGSFSSLLSSFDAQGRGALTLYGRKPICFG